MTTFIKRFLDYYIDSVVVVVVVAPGNMAQDVEAKNDPPPSHIQTYTAKYPVRTFMKYSESLYYMRVHT